MKKTLVALAALAATSAFAQSGVTLYGNLDQGLYRNTDSGVTNSSISSNIGSTSTLGFRGTEDLGGGLSANFNLLSELSLKEGQVGSTSSGTAATTGQKANMFTRAANIQLASKDYGAVEVGRLQDLVWQAGGGLNNTNLNSFGWATLTATLTNSDAAAMGAFNSGSTTGDTTFSGSKGASGVANASNIGTGAFNFAGGVSYISPKLFNNTVTVSYALYGTNYAGATVALASKAGAGDAIRIEYANGPWTAQYASSNRNDAFGQQGFNVKVYGATYQLGNYKLVGAQMKSKYENNMSNMHDTTVNGLGVTYDATPMLDVSLGYTTMKDNEDSAYKTTITAVTARYKFTKRTLAYAGYGAASNDGSSNKQTMFYGGPAGTSAGGVTSTGLLVGIRHSF